MTLTDNIRDVRGRVAGWDPTALARAEAGAVCRGLVELAEAVARVQVLALVAAKATGVLVGFRDTAAWLRAQGVAGRDARVLGDAAWCVERSVPVREAVEAGALEAVKAAELRPVVELVTEGRCDDSEVGSLLDRARHDSVEQLRKAVQGVVLRVRQHEPRATNKVYESDAEHGQKQFRTLLNPEDHDKVRNALDRLVDEQWRAGGHDGEPGRYELPTLRAQALITLAERSLNGHRAATKSTAEVIVIVDAETFLTGTLRPGSVSRLVDGTPVHPTAIHTLADKAGIRCYTKACDGTVRLSDTIPIAPVRLDFGRTKRLASHEQRLALAVEHPGCLICGAPFAHTQAHHLEPWDHGGRADLRNLGPLCSHHHHLVHDHRWQLTRGPTGTWTLTPPGDDDPPRRAPSRRHRQPRTQHPTRSAR